MRSNHRSWNLVPLCTVLMLTPMIFGCGLDFGPGTIAGVWPSDSEEEHGRGQYTGAEMQGNSLHQIQSLQDLPAEYRRFFETNPKIIKHLIWVGEEHPEGYIFLNEDWRVRDMVAHIVGKVHLENPPIPVRHENDNRTYYSEKDAWNMYLAHVAYTLKAEVNKLVPWSLADYTEDELALFFDSRYFVTFVQSEGLYRFSYGFLGGRQGVTERRAHGSRALGRF